MRFRKIHKRRIDKRKIYAGVAIFIGLTLCAFKLLGVNTDNAKESSADIKTEAKETVKLLESSENGNISYEENEFFKKYIIRLNEEQKSVNFIEEGKSIKLTFGENEQLNLNSTSFDVQAKETIYRKAETKSNELYINTTFEGNNFVYIDQWNHNNIIVITSKSEDPYRHKVLIDAGHGGVDMGANVGNLLEKDITLKIAKYTVNDLRYNGIIVKLSRDEDKTIKIEDVAAMANDMKADVLVSVHINFFEVDKYNGVGTYYNFFTGNEELNKNERIKLANIVQKHIVKDDEWKNRGITKEKLKILRLSEMPCVLVECGFLSNPSDREKLQKEEVLMNLAKNIDNAILEFLNSK